MLGNEKKLVDIIRSNPYIQQLYDGADHYLTNYYIGAGVITQTVWNTLHGYELTHGIGDADIIYFATDQTLEDEKELEHKLRGGFPTFPFQIDVTNEALVHLWYEEKFKQAIDPYPSAEAAIDTWPTTASAVGVRRRNGHYDIYDPFGLEDLFQMVVRPNKKLVTKEVYEQKTLKWKSRWPELTIIPW